MNHGDGRILLLDARSQAKLTSSARVTSLNDVVVELIKNALDASAKRIEVSLNYTTGFCTVSDDGSGIPASEFSVRGNLSQEYCTSRRVSQIYTYGRFGRSLARIAGVGLLCVISKASENTGTYVLWRDESGRISDEAQCPEDKQLHVGTTVKVYNLFSKVPVRSKYISETFSNSHETRSEFDKLRRLVLELVLASAVPFEIDIRYPAFNLRYHHRPTAVRLMRSNSSAPYKSFDSVRSILRQAGYLHGPDVAGWCELDMHSESISGSAIFSTVPLPHKDIQFINIGNKALCRSKAPEIFERVDSFFHKSTFGASPETESGVAFVNWDSPDGHRNEVKQRGGQKSVDRYPMFIIWLEDTHAIGLSEILYTDILSATTEATASRIATFLELMVSEFLLENGFLTENQVLPARRTASSKTVHQAVEVSASTGHAFETNFQHFSKLKSSSCQADIDILTGLPFCHTVTNHSDTRSADRSEQLANLDSDQASVHLDEGDLLLSNGVEDNQEPIQWLDSSTGKCLNIDPRTGMGIPHSAQFEVAMRNETRQNEASTRSVRSSTGAHPERHDSIARTARNISKHFDVKFGIIFVPTRSLGSLETATRSLSDNIMPSVKRQANCWLGSETEFSSSHKSTYDQNICVTKQALAQACSATQIDRKFILAIVPSPQHDVVFGQDEDAHLILLDQHAADERCRVEELLGSIGRDEPVFLRSSIHFEIAADEVERFHHIATALVRWQIIAELRRSVEADSFGTLGQRTELIRIEIRALPAAIAERCRLNPKLIIDILREVMWSDTIFTKRNTSNISVGSNKQKHSSIADHMPSRLLDLINSRACRSAVMFNDFLDTKSCQDLVHRLSNCILPFQCAHGRPSMVVIASMQSIADCMAKPLELPSKQALILADSTVLAASDRYGLNTVLAGETPSFADAYRTWAGTNIATDMT